MSGPTSFTSVPVVDISGLQSPQQSERDIRLAQHLLIQGLTLGRAERLGCEVGSAVRVGKRCMHLCRADAKTASRVSIVPK